MMLPSHVLATILAGLLVPRRFAWTSREWTLALLFGVAIDLDHLLQLPRYLAERGAEASLADAARWGASWQGFMHGPTAIPALATATVLTRSLVPASAWGLHMVLDFVVARRFVAYASAAEWAVVAALSASIVLRLLADRRREGSSVSFGRYAGARFRRAARGVVAEVARLPASRGGAVTSGARD